MRCEVHKSANVVVGRACHCSGVKSCWYMMGTGAVSVNGVVVEVAVMVVAVSCAP